MPKVSVIIPAYNAQAYLPETIDSVLAQTYSDYELIVVDDGSKDRTVSIVKQYQTMYPEKIKLILKENGGPASARNLGVKAASGEYIAFNDADDLWLPSKLEKQINLFEKLAPHVGLVYNKSKKFDNDGIWTLPEKFIKIPVKGWIYKDLLKDNMIPNQSVIVRKKCFDEVGLFDESPKVVSSEDYDMWLRIAMKYEVSFIDEVLSLYREHPQGINKNYAKAISAEVKVLEKHSNIVEGNIELEGKIKNAYSQQLYNLGYFYLKEGRMFLARRMFKESLAVRFSLKTYLMRIATFIPIQLLNISNKLIKSIFKPPKIVKSKYKLKNS